MKERERENERHEEDSVQDSLFPGLLSLIPLGVIYCLYFRSLGRMDRELKEAVSKAWDNESIDVVLEEEDPGVAAPVKPLEEEKYCARSCVPGMTPIMR